MHLKKVPAGGVPVRAHLQQLAVAASGEVLLGKGIAHLRPGVVVQLVEEQLIGLECLLVDQPFHLLRGGPGPQKGGSLRVLLLQNALPLPLHQQLPVAAPVKLQVVAKGL